MSRLLKRRWVLILGLFIFALGVRTFRAWQMPVILQDAIRNIEQAQRLPIDFLGALRDEVYHPMHAAAILLVHSLLPGAPASVEATRLSWAFAAQIVGIVAGAIMAPLLYLLALRFGARPWAALAAALLWCLEKRTSAFGADGMSDMLALCLFTTSILLALRGTAIRNRLFSARHGTTLFLAGLCAGLGYLTRPEVLAAPLIISLTLLATWTLRALKKPSPAYTQWKFAPRRALPLKTIAIILSLLWAGVAIPAAPYAAAIGTVTNKKQLNPPAELLDATPQSPPNAALWLWKETARTLGYGPLALLLIVFAMNTRPWGRPRLRLLATVWAALWLTIMCWLLLNYGYLAGRHTLILQVLLFTGVALALQRIETHIFPSIARPLGLYRVPHQIRRTPVVPLAVLVLLVATALPSLRRPAWTDIHAEAKAAVWAREHLDQHVLIADWHLVVGYYAMRPYQRWWGHTEEIDHLRAPGKPVVLGKFFKEREPLQFTFGNYHAIAIFNEGPPLNHGNSPPQEPRQGATYILYATPEDLVGRGGVELPPIDLTYSR